MKIQTIAIILAILLFGGLFFFFYEKSPSGGQQAASSTPAQSETGTPTITNYDECIAAGNQPLPDAPDKCLTKDGHIFIQGVVE